MTGKTFRTHVYATIAALLIASFVTLWIGVQCTEDYASASRTIVPVYITVAAAWLTFCLQRRVAYTNALRSLWEKVVHSVHEAIHYTRLKSPTESDLESLRCELCCRIDEVRGVFRNVGEIYLRPSAQVGVFVRSVKHAKDSEQLEKLLGSEHIDESMIGLYPFESLKQILTVIERLGSGSTATEHRASIARGIIWQLWRILRSELLKELDRDFPEFPDTPYEPGNGRPALNANVAKAMSKAS